MSDKYDEFFACKCRKGKLELTAVKGDIAILTCPACGLIWGMQRTPENSQDWRDKVAASEKERRWKPNLESKRS